MIPEPSPADAARPTADEVNARIRALSEGRAHWTPAALAELDRLRAQWQAAVDREAELAA